MYKYAAEKIAQEFYAMGSQAALEKLALNPQAAMQLARGVSEQIGAAGRSISRAGGLSRLSGRLPGTQMNRAQATLRGASGNVNHGFAENAHVRDFVRGGRPDALRTGYRPEAMSPEYIKGMQEHGRLGFIDPLSKELQTMPSEAVLRGIR